MELLWTDFLNSEWHDWRGSGRSEDRLDKPEWLTEFLADHQLEAPVPPSPPELEALKTWRNRLRAMAASLAAGNPLTAADVAAVNEVLAVGPVTRRLGGEEHPQLHLVPAGHGWRQVMAEVTASFAATLAEGEGARVRMCENPDCRWVFYDDTRNRTKRFCDDKLCGNLMKVRRFRARQKAADKDE